MAGVLGGNKPKAPAYTGLQLNTSAYGLPVPIVIGRTRIAPNVGWFENMQLHPGKQPGKGTGSSSTGTQDNYTVDLILMLCEGPISGVGTIWQNGNNNVTNLATLVMNFSAGNYGQPVWPYLEQNYPNQALGYSGFSFLYQAGYSLGNTSALPNWGIEAYGFLEGTAPNGIDADPSQAIPLLLSNPSFGAGFPADRIGELVTQSETHVVPAGTAPSVAVTANWVYNLCVVDDAGELYTCVAPGVTPGPDQYSFVNGTYTFAPSSAGKSVTIRFASNAGLATYQSYALALGLWISPAYTSQQAAASMINDIATLTNSAIVWSAGSLSVKPYGTVDVTGNGYTYQAQTAPLFSLTDDDFLPNQGSSSSSTDDPVVVTRTRSSDQFNDVQLEVLDRGNQYAPVPVDVDDPARITARGYRPQGSQQAHIFSDPVAGHTAAQLLLQRQFVRNGGTFTVDERYCVLDGMDIIGITDQALGWNDHWVQLVEGTENDDGSWTLIADQYPTGTGAPASYSVNVGQPRPIDQNQLAAPVNLPVIFEPSADLTQAGAQIWVGVSGGNNGVFDPNWGGADVLVSADNVEYENIGTIKRAACQGYLTAALAAPAGANPDETSSLSVDLTESAGTLITATQADAAAGRTLCWVDGEIIAYATATLTGQNQYTLTYLERGLYGTTPAAHPAGTAFLRLNDAVFKYGLPKENVGAPIWLKFISFNIYGEGRGDQSTAVAYSLTPTGNGFFVAPPTDLQASQAVVSSSLGMRVDITVTWTASATSWVSDYQVSYQMGNGAWTTFTTGGQPAADIPNVLEAVYTIKVVAVGMGLTSEPVEITWDVTTDSLSLPAVTGLELTGQANGAEFVGQDAHFDWRMNSSYGSSEALTASNSAGSNYLDSWFANYRVTIFDSANNALRTETVTDPSYVYTFEKNASDPGGPHRSFRIEVVWTDKLNRVSAPASITVSNPAPSFPTKIVPLSAFKTVSVQYQPPADLDYAGTLVFMQTESFGGADPDPSTLVYDGTDTLVNIPTAAAGTQYFLVLASYDSFGKSGLNYSSEYTTTTALVGSTDIATAAITTQQLDQDLNSAIDLVTAGPETPGSLQAALASILTLGDQYTQINDTVESLSVTVGGNTATITNEQSVRAAADKANASAISALSALVGNSYATITQLNSAIATAEQAATQQVNTLSASLGGTYATFTTVNQAIAGINASSSTFLQQLNSTVGSATTSIQQQASTINGLTAQYTVKIDANGHVAGFGLASTPVNGTPFSSFVVNVDDFAVAAPGATSFALEVVNGVVTIPNAAIQNAAITNAKIGNLAVDNSNIAAGAATVAGSVNIGATTGTGGYVNVATTWITLKSAATVVLQASWGCNYDSGFGNTNQQFFGQIFGNTNATGPVLHTGVATTQTPAYMWSTTLPQGTYEVVFWWQADNSHVQILAGSMAVIASQK